MNLEEIKSRIDKLNRYYEFLASLRGSVSALDRDVLLMQLREFYEAVLFAELGTNVSVNQKAEITHLKEKQQAVENKQEILEQKIEQAVEKSEPKVEKVEEKQVVINVPEIKLAPEPEKIEKEILPEPIIEIQKVETTPKVEEIIKVEEATVIERTEEPTPKVQPTENLKHENEFDFNPEYEELFIFKQATDLAAKLSESPVSDLSKVLGVNEKLLYAKELFAGDMTKFNEVVSFFNSAGYFDKARSFMEYNLIEQYNWMSKDKKASAREFVKLIRRRYL